MKDIGMLVTSCGHVPIFKEAEPIENLRMGHGLFAKVSFSHFVNICSCFLKFYTKFYIQVLFHALRHDK
jgi:hypothetical protein